MMVIYFGQAALWSVSQIMYMGTDLKSVPGDVGTDLKSVP
jgi:hypothetical protein